MAANVCIVSNCSSLGPEYPESTETRAEWWIADRSTVTLGILSVQTVSYVSYSATKCTYSMQLSSGV
jgi:hypothetical protein